MSIKPNSATIRGAYAVALLLVIVPASEIILRVWPLRFGDVAWRFGAVGLLSNAVITPLLGILIGGMLAFVYGHRRTIRFFSMLCLAGACLLFIAAALFILDTLQMRGQATAEARLAFDITAVQALLKLGVVTVIAAVLGFGAWRSARSRVRPEPGAPAALAGRVR